MVQQVKVVEIQEEEMKIFIITGEVKETEQIHRFMVQEGMVPMLLLILVLAEAEVLEVLMLPIPILEEVVVMVVQE